MWVEARPLGQEKARLGRAGVLIPFHRSELGVFLRLLLTKKIGLFSGAAADMFCFPQMGIISLLGSRLTAQAAGGGWGGRPWGCRQLCGADADSDTLQQVGISFCHMEERAVGQFCSVMGTQEPAWLSSHLIHA